MRKTKKHLITIFIIITSMVGGVAYAINWAFFDIQRIKLYPCFKRLGEKYSNIASQK